VREAAMKAMGLFLAALLAGPAFAQSIEGYWQDTERRILYSPDAPPGYVFGRWTALDQAQTYPAAKSIRRAGDAYELDDLLYDNEEAIKVLRAAPERIDFTRTNRLTSCTTVHACELQAADQLFCALETRCAEQVVWRGEERYARRATCERDGKRQQQGIPVRCR
jgi:hypothetical protein